MGRIADAATALLSDRPLAPDELGRALAEAGVTRSRDPAAAVRRALRDDPRVILLPDRRFASLAAALTGVELATIVSRIAVERGYLDVDSDLAPIAVLGTSQVEIPAGVRPGDRLVVRVDAVAPPAISVAPTSAFERRPDDEALVGAAIHAQIGDWSAHAPWASTPVAPLGLIVTAVAAGRPTSFRTVGRPLSEVLAALGYELQLGWVGARGTPWRSITELEIETYDDDVADLLASECLEDAAEAQGRLVSLLDRYAPERAAPGRRLHARILARLGNLDEARAILVSAFARDDPEDRYEAVLLAIRQGDLVSARRWANDGAARAGHPDDAAVLACLEDIAADLDAQAVFLSARQWLPAADEPSGAAEQLAQAIVSPRRSYLVEATVEELFDDIDPAVGAALIDAMGGLGEAGRDACLACSEVLRAPLDAVARRAAGERPRARRPWIAGLVDAAPTHAWLTSREDAPDQQQMVIVVAKESNRLSPLVVLFDHEQLDGAVKDAFFLPDIAAPRLHRELLGPMAEMGLPSHPIAVATAVRLLDDGLRRSASRRWVLPSSVHQPVIERIERWVLRRQAASTRDPSG